DNNLRGNSVREIVSHVAIAGKLGIPIATLHTGIEHNDESEINNLMESLFIINETALKNNVLIALENHTTEPVSVEVLISLIQKVGSENLGICLDVGHSNIFSNYMSDLSEARRYLFSLHLHDNNGEEDEHLFPYEGMIDFDYIIGFLRKSRFQGVVTLELNGENTDSDEELRDFLKKASVFIKGFGNPRLTYSNILEPT
ncbi:MAG: sugar phosphate isomerase/epimerase, partial [Deltaproteobacteria bacterium]|nr:sugar phosphate isomerase/epimerase [Deltaproteobacteria bacterium]